MGGKGAPEELDTRTLMSSPGTWAWEGAHSVQKSNTPQVPVSLPLLRHPFLRTVSQPGRYAPSVPRVSSAREITISTSSWAATGPGTSRPSRNRRSYMEGPRLPSALRAESEQVRGRPGTGRSPSLRVARDSRPARLQRAPLLLRDLGGNALGLPIGTLESWQGAPGVPPPTRGPSGQPGEQRCAPALLPTRGQTPPSSDRGPRDAASHLKEAPEEVHDAEHGGPLAAPRAKPPSQAPGTAPRAPPPARPGRPDAPPPRAPTLGHPRTTGASDTHGRPPASSADTARGPKESPSCGSSSAPRSSWADREPGSV